MELKNGRVQIHYDRDNGDIVLRVINRDATLVPFVEVTLSSEQFLLALSGMALVEVKKMEVEGLDLIGKKKIVKPLVFEIDEKLWYNKEAVRKIALAICPEGWEPDLTFSNQDSFIRKDGKHYARTSLKRWV